MWEYGTPQPEQEQEKKPKKKQKSRENLVLWAQVALCGAALAAAACAKYWNLPYRRELRTAYTVAMSQPKRNFLGEDWDFFKFAELETAALRQAGREVFAELTGETDRKIETAQETADVRLRRRSPPPSSLKMEACYSLPVRLVFPLPGGNCEKTSAYGWRTDPMGGQGSDFHTGEDLAAPQGTAIFAAADGVVRYAGVHSSYGNYLRILHGNGDETLYAHLQYVFVRTGQTVKAGETLGTVGETGNATGPHLHFEILHQGVRYDPTEALQAAY